MSAVWERLKPAHHGGTSGTDGGGAGSARGAYYGTTARPNIASNTSNLNFHASSAYTYSIKGGPAPPRPPREFRDPSLL
jgi:hypothetical protein